MKKIQLLAAKFAAYLSTKTANSANITVDDSKFEKSVRDYLDDLMAESDEKQANIDSLTKDSLEIFNKNLQKVVTNIENAISNLSWNGSKIVLKPSTYYDSILRKYTPISILEDKPWIEAGTIWYIMVDTDINRMSPGFTYIVKDGKSELGDVLDAGDRDFFKDDLVEADYFALVNGLRYLGKERKEKEKVITLFTARPKQERNLYVGKKEVPNNIWLTTSKSEAEGIASDLADYVEDHETGITKQEIRDVYMVKINNRYLIQTDHPNHFQVYNPGSQTVPVEQIYLW